MAEPKTRRDSTTRAPRARPKTDQPGAPQADAGPEDDRDQEPVAERPEAVATAPPERRPAPPTEEDYIGFDEEINSRYEEIKRGSTHISELQQMTMPQLLKIA